MDDKKIAFITCVNDESMYKEMLFYIGSLEMPKGYTYECVGVRNAPSMTCGYNIGMLQSDARYKVYLHQDIRIVHTGFISNLLDIFRSDSQIGIVGMVGAVTIPPDGIWWSDTQTFGCVYQENIDTGRAGFSTFSRELVEDALAVQASALDGLLLATQYDLPWRQDLFDNWHFYDLSQCFEFLRSGYRVSIANQRKNGVEEPWCLHLGKCTLGEPWKNACLRLGEEYGDILQGA